MAVKAIIFDLSEVFIHGLLGVEHLISEKIGVDAQDVYQCLAGDNLRQICAGSIPEPVYWNDILETTRWPLTVGDLSQLARQNFQNTVDGMTDLPQSLKGKYQLVLLSDHGREWFDYIQEIHPFLEAFDQKFMSFTMGKTKHELNTYHYVVDQLRHEPQECVFIDDLKPNIERAKSIGIQAFQFESKAKLIGDLQSISISI